MSRIAGLLGVDGQPADLKSLEKLLEPWRDHPLGGRYLWTDGAIGLAQTAFAPGASGDACDDGRLVCVADARLDDKEALATALNLSGQPLNDAQLICSAYRRWGTDCAEHLLGDFAFAIWDRDQQLLLCARDHFGVRPFFYALDDTHFAFASESRALRASGLRPFPVREVAIGEYLARLSPPPADTFFSGMSRLAPGHSLVIKNGQAQIASYWSLNFNGAAASANPAADFLGLFTQAVRRRAPSGDQLGALLSGGLDSSSIVRVAAPSYAAERHAGLPTISAVFDETPQWNERGFIESVLAEGDCRPTLVPSNDYAPFKDLDGMLREQDAPFLAPGLTLNRGLYAVARREGLFALLDGHGGDETVSHGHGRIHDLATARRWGELWREMHGIGQIYGAPQLANFLRHFFYYSRLRPLASAMVKATRPFRRARADTQQALSAKSFVREDFAERIHLAEREAELKPAPASSAQAMHLADLTGFNSAKALEVLDHQANAKGIELRYPFLDKDLVEFCLNLPPEQKLGGGWSRLVLRRAMEGLLPKMVQWRRTKLDFLPHMVLGMIKYHTALIEGVIHQDSGHIAGYVDLDVVAGAYSRMQAQRENTSAVDVMAIYQTVILSEWNRKNYQAL